MERTYIIRLSYNQETSGTETMIFGQTRDIFYVERREQTTRRKARVVSQSRILVVPNVGNRRSHTR